MASPLVLFFSLAGILALAAAYDEDSMLDFCVADLSSRTRSNAYDCKPEAEVTGEDFRFSLAPAAPGPGFVRAKLGLTAAFVQQFPALNLQGLSAGLLSWEQGGQTPFHTHIRASELLYLLQGSVKVGFVSNNNVLYQTLLKPGDLFLFPKGLLHFQQNVGAGPASALAVLNSQDPGIQLVLNALLASSSLHIDDATVAQGLGVSPKTVKSLRKAFMA